LLRIEGHAKLSVAVKGGRVTVRFSSVEGERLFEDLVKGKKYWEVPSLVSRICGICSYSHVLASIRAIEDCLGLEVPEHVGRLRELLHLSSIALNHAVHLFFLVLPDLKPSKTSEKRLLRSTASIVEACNSVFQGACARFTHPVGATVGGFRRPPKLKEVRFDRVLEQARQLAEAILTLESRTFPFETYGACCIDEDYSFLGDRIALSDGRLLSKSSLERLLREEKRSYSRARFYTLDGKPVAAGAIARLNLGHEKLGDTAKELMKSYSIKPPLSSPFANNVAQALELVHCVERAGWLLEELRSSRHDRWRVEHAPKKGRGCGTIEAPRGLLYHRYDLGENGVVRSSKIVTPTAINSACIEKACASYASFLMKSGAPKAKVVEQLEALVRSFDPCIPCAVHLEVVGEK